MKKKRYGRNALVVIAILVAVFAVLEFRLHKRAWFSFNAWRHSREWRGKSIWLPDYRVVVDALPIEGIEKNLSGLTWNGDTQTLFGVINNPGRIVELSRDGVLLRGIDLRGFEDPEAIEYIGGGEYIVADERTQKVMCVTIDADTTGIQAEGLQRLSLGMGHAGNLGIEGLAWDPANRKLYAAKERNPVHIYEVTGFPQEPNTTMDIEVSGDSGRDSRLFLSDVSSLDFNQRFQHLLVLSHESRVVIEVDKNGHPVSSMSLLPIPQAEGLAMDDRDDLYIVSEPNLFYKFTKQRK